MVVFGRILCFVGWHKVEWTGVTEHWGHFHEWQCGRCPQFGWRLADR